MKYLSLTSIMAITIILSSCARNKDSDKISALNKRLKVYEEKLNSQSQSTIEALASGQCQLEQIDANTASLKCGNGNAFTIKNGTDGKDGVSCSVLQNLQGASIQCSDGTVATILNGQNGEDGQDGSNGSSCQVTQSSSGSIIQCSDGTIATVSNGVNGGSCQVIQEVTGAQIKCDDGTTASIAHGTNGQNGSDGAGCSVERIDGVGALVICGDTKALITDGEDGKTPMSPLVEVINPCEEQKFDEVLLKFSDGTIIGHYSDGAKQHLTVLLSGWYSTTDGFKCNFFVTEDGNVKW